MANLIAELELLSTPAEPLPLRALLDLLRESLHRTERILGCCPGTWGPVVYGAALACIPETPIEPAVEHFISCLPSESPKLLLELYARWEAADSPMPNPFEPLVQIYRHGGRIRRPEGQWFDLSDYAGERAGVPIASMSLYGRPTTPHILVKLRLFGTEHANPTEPTRSHESSGFITMFGMDHPLRFDLRGAGSLAPGAMESGPVPAHFDSPEFVLPFLRVGDEFMLRDGRIIGQGKITEILVHMPPQGNHPATDAAPITALVSEGWVSCPCCRKRFSLADPKRWNGERHVTCGQRLTIHVA